MTTLGNREILKLEKIAFLSSRKVPPAAVMASYDWATRMCAEGTCVIGGFQSALERDVLKILLKGGIAADRNGSRAVDVAHGPNRVPGGDRCRTPARRFARCTDDPARVAGFGHHPQPLRPRELFACGLRGHRFTGIACPSAGRVPGFAPRRPGK